MTVNIKKQAQSNSCFQLFSLCVKAVSISPFVKKVTTIKQEDSKIFIKHKNITSTFSLVLIITTSLSKSHI